MLDYYEKLAHLKSLYFTKNIINKMNLGDRL